MTKDDTGPQSSADKKSTFGGKQWIATILTLVVVVFVFAVVFPSLGNYADAWTAIQGMSTGWIIVLIIATIGAVLIYPWPFQMALPGLKYRPAFAIRQTSFMISNVIPAGGAIGLGVQYGMLEGHGFKSAASAAAIGITSVANTIVTLALPVLALIGLILIGEATSEDYIAAIIGVGILAVATSLIAYVLRTKKSARKAGEWADGAID